MSSARCDSSLSSISSLGGIISIRGLALVLVMVWCRSIGITFSVSGSASIIIIGIIRGISSVNIITAIRIMIMASSTSSVSSGVVSIIW